MKYRKKPIEVDAVQWFSHGDHPAVHEYADNKGIYSGIKTIEGMLRVTPGCWIVGPGAKGEYWPVQDDIFKATYESVPTK